MDNKQAAEAMPPGEFQKVPEICNCQEAKCRKRVDAAIEAMREACEYVVRDKRELIQRQGRIVGGAGFLKTAMELRKVEKAIRALKVEEVLK